MKRINTLLLVIITALISAVSIWLFLKFKRNVHQEEQAQIVLEKINEASKLIVIESQFSEVYTFKEVEHILNLLPARKKAIVIVKAKASIAYNLEQLDYSLDYENQKIVVNKLPKAEIIIEPNIKYYDIEESTFNKFSVTELNNIQEKTVKLIEREVENSNLIALSEERVETVLYKLLFENDVKQWQIEMPIYQ